MMDVSDWIIKKLNHEVYILNQRDVGLNRDINRNDLGNFTKNLRTANSTKLKVDVKFLCTQFIIIKSIT